MKLYICGPITGFHDYNRHMFNSVAARLRGDGYEVVNPLEICADIVGTPAGAWVECMRRDITALVQCDGLAVLPGWQTSRGANLEIHIAEALGLEVKMEYRWGPVRGARGMP